VNAELWAADFVCFVNCNSNCKYKLLAANDADDANRDAAVGRIPFAKAKSVRCFCSFKKEGDEHRPRRDALSRVEEQIRVIREIRGPQFQQSFQYSRLRFLAPFSA